MSDLLPDRLDSFERRHNLFFPVAQWPVRSARPILANRFAWASQINNRRFVFDLFGVHDALAGGGHTAGVGAELGLREADEGGAAALAGLGDAPAAAGPNP